MKFGDFRRDSGQDWAQLRENAYAYNDDGSLVRVDAEHFFNVGQTLLPFRFRLQFLRR